VTTIKRLLPLLLLAAGLGCTSSAGQTYRSAEWRPDRPLGKVLVIVPKYRTASGDEQPAKDRKIRDAVREALLRVPGTTVLDDAAASAPAAAGAGKPVSESEAVAAGRRVEAETVCIVTLGQFGGRYLLTALPPGWDSRTTVQYALRILDVKSGEVLVDSVRERTAGGYLAIMTATYPSDLTKDLTSVLSTER